MSQNETTKLQENTGPDCWSCCSENKSEMVKLVNQHGFSCASSIAETGISFFCVSTFDVAAI